MQDNEERLIKIETLLTEHERELEDLNQVIIEQGKRIDTLQKQNQYLVDMMKQETVKSQEEETPPPHY